MVIGQQKLNMIKGCHHVGLIVEDYERTVNFYRKIFNATMDNETTINGKIDVSFLKMPNHKVEVICRRERGTELDELLDLLCEHSQYHVAYAVSDIEECIHKLEEEGYRMHDGSPVEGIGPYSRAFVHPADVPCIPIELVEHN